MGVRLQCVRNVWRTRCAYGGVPFVHVVCVSVCVCVVRRVLSAECVCCVRGVDCGVVGSSASASLLDLNPSVHSLGRGMVMWWRVRGAWCVRVRVPWYALNIHETSYESSLRVYVRSAALHEGPVHQGTEPSNSTEKLKERDLGD